MLLEVAPKCASQKGEGHQLECRQLNSDSMSIAAWVKVGGRASRRDMAEVRAGDSGKDTAIS